MSNYAEVESYKIHALTSNGREIGEVLVRLRCGKTAKRYEVQPHNDNYWMTLRTPEAALRAYYHPERYRGA